VIHSPLRDTVIDLPWRASRGEAAFRRRRDLPDPYRWAAAYVLAAVVLLAAKHPWRVQAGGRFGGT
jgi:hypothetical protein